MKQFKDLTPEEQEKMYSSQDIETAIARGEMFELSQESIEDFCSDLRNTIEWFEAQGE